MRRSRAVLTRATKQVCIRLNGNRVLPVRGCCREGRLAVLVGVAGLRILGLSCPNRTSDPTLTYIRALLETAAKTSRLRRTGIFDGAGVTSRATGVAAASKGCCSIASSYTLSAISRSRTWVEWRSVLASSRPARHGPARAGLAWRRRLHDAKSFARHIR
jgi:hypothetical protein